MPAYRFSHTMEVRYGDLDPQGHLNNAKYLTYFEQARVEYFAELGLFTRDQSFSEIGVIVADIHIRYEAPVVWGAPVSVGVRTTKIGHKSLVLEQRIAEPAGERVFATGTVVLVAYDYNHHQTMQVSEAWRAKIEQFEGRKLA